MKFLLVLSALAAFDIVSVIAGPVPENEDTAIVPRAEQSTEATPADADPRGSTFDLNRFFGRKHDPDLTESSDDDDDDPYCWWWWWCPPDEPEEKKKLDSWCWWYWCPPDDEPETKYSIYGFECPDADDLSCDSCGGVALWNGLEIATKGWATGCECTEDDDDEDDEDDEDD